MPCFEKLVSMCALRAGVHEEEEEEEEEEIIRLPCLVGRVVGPLLAARALPLRCAASTMLSSALLAI
jgi:hypothetical protein